MKMLQRVVSQNWRPGQAAVVGLIATGIYSVAMEGDMSLTGNRFSDVRFIEGLIGGTKSSKRLLALAWGFHFLNGVVLAEIYAAVLKRFLPGPDWLRGAIFGESFIAAVWWLTPLADKYHPLIKNGELPKLATWTSFFQNLERHLVFGLALGLLYRSRK